MAEQDQSLSQLFLHVGFLDELSNKDMSKVVEIATIRQFDEGKILFQEGSVNTNLFLVVSGSVALDMHVPRRGQIRILTVGPGEILAWSALLGDQSMTAMATVLEATTLVSMPGRQLRELCDADRDVGYAVMHRMAVALSRRLLATRLQLLDVFSETQPA